jgi:uncharacterized membrane protein YjgN (DUF898 family)
MTSNPSRFTFDGGAATFVGTAIGCALIVSFTFGLGFPFAVVLGQRWLTKHSYIDGNRLVFTGTAVGLFGHWIKWYLLCVVTLGIYTFWVIPQMVQWTWEHTAFDSAATPVSAEGVSTLRTGW